MLILRPNLVRILLFTCLRFHARFIEPSLHIFDISQKLIFCAFQALPQVGEDDLHTLDQDTDLLADLLDQEDPLAPGLLQTGLLTAQEATPPPGGRAQV